MNSDSEKQFEKTVEIVNRRQKFFRKTKTAANLVAHVMTKRSIAAENADEQLVSLWNRIVGKKIAQHTRTGLVRRGVLDVIVDSSAVHQKLQFQKKKILDQLQREEITSTLIDIRFRIGQI